NVRQAVIGFFLVIHSMLTLTRFPAADDLEGFVENRDIDPIDIRGSEGLALLQLEDAFNGRLAVNFGVVPLDARARHDVQRFAGPVDRESLPGDRRHVALLAVEHVAWTVDPVSREERV